MSPVEKPQPTLTQAQVRLLVLIVLLALVIGFAIGFRWMSVREVAGQVMQGLSGGLLAILAGAGWRR